jgi:ankyrin repeat protein
VDDRHLELRNAIKRADVMLVTQLIEAGVDIHYRNTDGYTAAIDACYGARQRGEQLIVILELLLQHGVDLDAVSSYSESALSVLSYFGRFDGVRFLLNAGANPSPLRWTPLHEAVVMGTIDDVRRNALPEVLEDPDHDGRTAWLMALLVGDREKAQLLLDRGANPTPRVERGRPALFYAIDAGRADLVGWLLDLGQPVDSIDEAGDSALHHAAGRDEVECVDVLIAAGANVNSARGFESVLAQASSASLVRRLIGAGGDPADLSHEGARALCRLDGGLEVLEEVSGDAFKRGRTRRFGITNPERIVEPFWEAMIRCGVSAYEGGAALGGATEIADSPTWCAHRFGQSTTELADGRVIQIGGEHEDFYDADFCIYNDVFVHALDGGIEIFGYPEDVFAPTDFHTATLVGPYIYVVGSLGYQGTRRFNETPV